MKGQGLVGFVSGVCFRVGSKDADRDGVRSRLLRFWVVVLERFKYWFLVHYSFVGFDLETERLLDRVELEEKVKEYNSSLQELRYKILNSSFFIRILF